MQSYDEDGRTIYYHGNWAKDELGPSKLQRYDEILKECRRKKVSWKDDSFPASLKSIGKIDNDAKANLNNLVWVRAPELVEGACYLRGQPHPGLIIQGSCGDCYFLVALAVLTKQPTMFSFCCPEQDFDEEGYCGVLRFRFFKWSRWLEVVIDDYLPTLNGELFFAKGSDKNELLVPLAEKAYAKLLGSYAIIEGGFTASALVELTGGVGWFTMLGPRNAAPLFEDIRKMNAEDTFFGASILKRGKETRGIQHLHAYGVLGVEWVLKGREQVPLIKLYNPWGETEWTGPWHDKCGNWNLVSKSTKQRLHHKIKDEGIFFMEYKDVINTFTLLDACTWRVPPAEPGFHLIFGESWHVQIHHGVWKEASNEDSLVHQPHLRLKFFRWSCKKVTLSLSQRHARVEDDVPVYIKVLMLANEDKGKRLTSNVLARASTVASTRDDMAEVKLSFTAERGREYVSVFQNNSPRPCKFLIRAFAERVPATRRPTNAAALTTYLSGEHLDAAPSSHFTTYKRDMGKY